MASNPITHPKIYTHEPSGSTLLPHLLPLLPAALPLARRLQSHHRSPYSRVLATFPPHTPAPSPPPPPHPPHRPVSQPDIATDRGPRRRGRPSSGYSPHSKS